MLLLTGATGTVGSALLSRLTARRTPVRCLVRDPRRLGSERVRVQIALGDLADPPSFRNAMRGVDTVVHLAASARDQDGGSIEELNGIATWRMVEAAQRAGVKRFIFFSGLGASPHHRTRLLRSKALAEKIVTESSLSSTVVAPSFIYAPGDRRLRLIEAMAMLPVVAMSGRGRAEFQPIWAEDVADAVLALLPSGPTRVEMAGPQLLTHEQIVRLVAGRGPVVGVPTVLVSRALRLAEAAMKSKAPAVWDEAELLEVSMTTTRGTRDADALGVHPAPMARVLGD